MKDFEAANDALLFAYDRAIRSQLDQHANIDRSKLELQLREENSKVQHLLEFTPRPMRMASFSTAASHCKAVCDEI